MALAYVKSLQNADERRPFAAHGYVDVVNLGERGVGCGTFEPGWRWSQDVKPIARTDTCMAEHSIYVLAGRMRIQMNDGQSLEIKAGDVAVIPPGHDAWVEGTEACRLIDFSVGASQYAKPTRGISQPQAEPPQADLSGTPAQL